MAIRRRPSSTGKQTGTTPLDARQQALLDEQAKLRDQMERLEKLIQDAPKIAEQRERERREEFLLRSSTYARRPESPAALRDKRYDVDMPMRSPRRGLKSQRREERMKLLVLCVVLAGILIWLISIIS